MVGNVTSYSSNGLRDWLVQRATAVILAIYSIFIIDYLIVHPHLVYADWQQLFAHTWMKVATLLALLSVLLHALIGLWTVLTDYVKPAKLRMFILILVILTLMSCLLWGIIILWSV